MPTQRFAVLHDDLSQGAIASSLRIDGDCRESGEEESSEKSHLDLSTFPFCYDYRAQNTLIL